MGDLAFSVGGDFQAFGQSVGHAHADAVQAAGEAVSPALAFVKFAASVQAGENDLDDGHFFLWVHAKGDAPSIVFNAHRAIGVQDDSDFFAVTS